MTHNCVEQAEEAIDRLIAQSEERKMKEFNKNGRSQEFWVEVAYCDGLKAGKAMINSHYDCMA